MECRVANAITVSMSGGFVVLRRALNLYINVGDFLVAVAK